MDKLASVLKLAKEIVALLDSPNAASAKAPTAAATANIKTSVVVKKAIAKIKTEVVNPQSNVKERTFSKLPKNKQTYLRKKQREARAELKKWFKPSEAKKRERYIAVATDVCVALAFVDTPKKLTLQDWKEGTDEVYHRDFYAEVTPYETNDDE